MSDHSTRNETAIVDEASGRSIQPAPEVRV